MSKRGIFILLFAFALVVQGSGASYAIVVDNTMIVTDVTPLQFCVVWETSEPARGLVNVFLDLGGVTPYAAAVVTSESVDHPPAEENGVMKVRVLGLKADTEYFFQTVRASKADNAVYISSISSVRTEKESIIVRNDILAQEVIQSDGTPAPGTLVIASVDGASYPVTGWVGDGIPEEWGAIDTNNFYANDDDSDSEARHKNLELKGGEVITLTIFGGSLGSAETQETVPAEKGGRP